MAQDSYQKGGKPGTAGLAGTAKLVVTVLQFLVGALVTMGGTLFATLAVNNFGTILGTIHLFVGLIGLIGGLIVLRGVHRSRTFLLTINGLTIAYSSLSESIAQIQSLLPPYASLGSLIGTVIAIIMSGAIIYLIFTHRSR